MNTKQKIKKTHRVQFEFSDDSLHRLDSLIPLTDSTSRAEVVRKALRLYEFIVLQTKKDEVMGFEKDGIFKPVISLL